MGRRALRRWGGLISAFVAISALVGCDREEPQPPPLPPSTATNASTAAVPESVILVIADGMGPQQMALLFDWADAAGSGPTALERFVERSTLGLVRTGASNSPLTDSASSATALASGVETYNGAIGVDDSRQPVPTCLEDAQRTGRRTGLVTTTRLTHATPAAFAAHVERRDMEAEIAAQMLAAGVHVMLGGGRRFFSRKAGEAAGYTVVGSEAALDEVPNDADRVLGIFADSHLPYAIDRDGHGDPDGAPESPTLAKLTARALDLLDRPEGFFLMIEAGRVDHGGHINDVAAVLGEMRELDETIELLLRHVATHPGTLVVVTADHETGGLAVSQGGMPLRPEHFLEMAKAERSFEAIAGDEKDKADVDPKATFGVGRRNFYPPYSWWETSRAIERSSQYNVSYASQTHTTTPVVCAAVGPGERGFAGLYHNEHIGQLLRAYMSREGAR